MVRGDRGPRYLDGPEVPETEAEAPETETETPTEGAASEAPPDSPPAVPSEAASDDPIVTA